MHDHENIVRNRGKQQVDDYGWDILCFLLSEFNPQCRISNDWLPIRNIVSIIYLIRQAESRRCMNYTCEKSTKKCWILLNPWSKNILEIRSELQLIPRKQILLKKNYQMASISYFQTDHLWCLWNQAYIDDDQCVRLRYRGILFEFVKSYLLGLDRWWFFVQN